MDENSAKNIMESLAWMSLPFDKLAREITALPPGDERDRLVELLKEIYHPFDGVKTEVVRQFREVDPVGDGEEWFFSMRQKYQTEEFPAVRLSPAQRESANLAGVKAAADIVKESKSDDSGTT